MWQGSHRPLLARVLASLSILSLLGLVTAISILATGNPGNTASSLAPPSDANQADASLPPPPTDANGNPLPPVGLPTSWTTQPESAALPTGASTNNAFGCNGSDTFTTRSDGDPYPVCPGPMPSQGGNCTWWAWQSWHRLGVNLPGWGNAALWAAAAVRAGYQVGTVPRVNSIAVFPVGDGVWAFSGAGHVAFVTQVYKDLDTFDVTYQNYGDPTTEHFGYHYRVSIIQQPQYQHGQLRFIYFPGSKGGSGSKTPTPTPKPATPTPKPAAPTPTPSPTTASGTTSSGNANAPDLYTGNFAGDGRTEVLRYNRSAGALELLSLSPDGSSVQVVSIHDSTTAGGKWGSAWEVYIGDLTEEGRDTLLLFDRAHGIGRFLRFNADLSVASDVEHDGWKSTWELYIGRFGNPHDDLLIYQRNLDQDHGQWTATPDESSNGETSPGSNTPNDWQHLHRTATLYLVDYKTDLSINKRVILDHWHNTWEIHPGHFGAEQNGFLLFDRQAGEARIMTFNDQMQIAQNYSAHHWNTTWEVYQGNFTGSGQDSVLLFNRSLGTAQLLSFTPTLALERNVTYADWDRSWAFYPGVWGGSTQNATGLFLYDQKQGQAAFVSIGPSLELASQTAYQNWHRTWNVFVGQFGASCATGSASPCLSTLLLVDLQAGQAKLVHFQFPVDKTADQASYSESALSWPS